MTQQLQGAVLIIGSLFWENESNAIEIEKGKLREQWRADELDLERAVQVNCPIRYGRKSSTRRDIYTMIFSNSVPVLGTGWLVPFKKKTSPDENFKDVFEQARYLAYAEGIRASDEQNTHKKWGMVAVKITLELKQRDAGRAEALTKWWADLHERIIDHRTYRIDGSEDTSVTAQGFLNFSFNIPDGLNDIDYVFATPVTPNAAQYPSAWEIAEAMKKSHPQYFTYFVENVANAINTYQDDEVKVFLASQSLSIADSQGGQLAIQNYSKRMAGYEQLQHDLLRKLGSKIFARTAKDLCYHCLALLTDNFDVNREDDTAIEKACSEALEKMNEQFKIFENPLVDVQGKDTFQIFLQYILELEKLPGNERERLEQMVKGDLRKRRLLIERYEKEAYIKEFKMDRITPRNHDENVLHDFYLRNIDEEQVILNYLLKELEKRAVYNCRINYLGTPNYFDWYYDRPYITSLPNSEEYFDHEKIDVSGLKTGRMLPEKAAEFRKLYWNSKIEFYEKLQEHYSVDQAIHEMKYFLSYLPVANAARKDIFEELFDNFKQKRWFSFYSLGLAQIEGLFTEMVKAIDPKSRKPSLSDKVESVRPKYDFSHRHFDYFQYSMPTVRNRFMHSGLDDDIEMKCYDVLYDLRYLLEVYIDLKTPMLEANKLIKRRDRENFHEMSQFNYYFDLLDALDKSKQLSIIKVEADEFERGFLVQDTDVEMLIAEIEQLLPQAMKHWYDTISVFTELNTVKLDFKNLTRHQLGKEKESYVERLKSVYAAHEDIFSNLLQYYHFLTRFKKYLPSLKQDLIVRLDGLYKTHQDDFEKLLIVTKDLSEKKEAR